MFWNTRNKIVQYSNLKASLNKIYRKAGIEGATHTYATRCFEAGVEVKAISEQLGHANVKTTYIPLSYCNRSISRSFANEAEH